MLKLCLEVSSWDQPWSWISIDINEFCILLNVFWVRWNNLCWVTVACDNWANVILLNENKWVTYCMSHTWGIQWFDILSNSEKLKKKWEFLARRDLTDFRSNCKTRVIDYMLAREGTSNVSEFMLKYESYGITHTVWITWIRLIQKYIH